MISRYKYVDSKRIDPDFTKRYWYGKISAYYPSGFLDDIDATCDTLDELASLKTKEDLTYSWEVFWDNTALKRVLLEEGKYGL